MTCSLPAPSRLGKWGQTGCPHGVPLGHTVHHPEPDRARSGRKVLWFWVRKAVSGWPLFPEEVPMAVRWRERCVFRKHQRVSYARAKLMYRAGLCTGSWAA